MISKEKFYWSIIKMFRKPKKENAKTPQKLRSSRNNSKVPKWKMFLTTNNEDLQEQLLSGTFAYYY